MLNEKSLRNHAIKRPQRIQVRKPQWTFAEFVGSEPRSEFGRMLFGALSIVFPEGERFFIRSVKHFAGQINDAALTQDIKDFIGQEAQHGKVHETYNKAVLGHDYNIEPFLAWYKSAMFDTLEKTAEAIFGPKLMLAVTAAAEHFTATWAAHSLSSGYLEEHVANQNMLDFMQWHAIEEIEHKHVAFDVLQEVDDSYTLRAAGMLYCATILPFVVSTAFLSLLVNAKAHTPTSGSNISSFLSDAISEGKNGTLLTSFIPAVLAYLKPGFHPSDNDDYEVARRVAEGIEQRMINLA